MPLCSNICECRSEADKDFMAIASPRKVVVVLQEGWGGGGGSVWSCRGRWSVPVNVRTPQSSHLCHRFSLRHSESGSVWSALRVGLILSGLTMKADLLCSSEQQTQPPARPIQTAPKIPSEFIIISTRDFWTYKTFASKSTDLHSSLP